MEYETPPTTDGSSISLGGTTDRPTRNLSLSFLSGTVNFRVANWHLLVPVFFFWVGGKCHFLKPFTPIKAWLAFLFLFPIGGTKLLCTLYSREETKLAFVPSWASVATLSCCTFHQLQAAQHSLHSSCCCCRLGQNDAIRGSRAGLGSWRS